MARPADSREVSGADGRAVCGPRVFGVLEDKSSRFGRGREDGMVGEPGSFLTWIMGGRPVRSLVNAIVSDTVGVLCISMPTHDSGDLLPLPLDVARSTVAVFSTALGEPLPRARFAAGSVRSALGEADAALAMDANWRGET